MSDLILGLVAVVVAVIVCIPLMLYLFKRLPKDLGLEDLSLAEKQLLLNHYERKIKKWPFGAIRRREKEAE